MDIQITPAARQRMRDFLDREPGASGIRFGARPKGCSGYAYVVELATERSGKDTVLTVDGIPLLVDAQSLPLVDGTRIDFRRQGVNESFVFDNPHATGECGCGESFTVAG